MDMKGTVSLRSGAQLWAVSFGVARACELRVMAKTLTL